MSRYLDVAWPLIVGRSHSGHSRHIVEEHPYPNGEWGTLCGGRVAWSAETIEDGPADWCSRCWGQAEHLIRGLEEMGWEAWNRHEETPRSTWVSMLQCLLHPVVMVSTGVDPSS